MADGSTKPVEAIQPGDHILAYIESTGAMGPSEVVEVHPPFVSNYHFVINERIRVTKTHPILSQGRWVTAGNLKVGDWLTTADGRRTPVISIRRVEDPALARDRSQTRVVDVLT
jgi:hypothetical protein